MPTGALNSKAMSDQSDRRFTLELTESEVIAIINHHAAMIRKITKTVGQEVLKTRGQREMKILVDEGERMIRERRKRGEELIRLIKP